MAKRRPSGDGMVRKREDGRWEGRIVVGHKENGDPIFQYVHAPTQKALLAKLHQNTEGRVQEHPAHGHQLSANTVRRIHTMLHRAMADAVQAHIIPRNPVGGVTLPKWSIRPSVFLLIRNWIISWQPSRLARFGMTLLY